MTALFVKELNAFLSSLTGYIVILLFLLATGLFLWVFPGEFNIPDSGYATLDSLFVIAPWVFMFLIPAITMRSFSEEKRNGTIELLLTKPLTEWNIILAKYLAGLLLVVIAVLPTLLFYLTIYDLGNPPGNIDRGGTIGSYLGLVFLGSTYVAIGLFASSISENQIVSFILAFFISFFCYFGFDSIAGIEFLKPLEHFIYSIGISSHYSSVSRGVLDTRDLIYFLSFNTLFMALTRFKLLSRSW